MLLMLIEDNDQTAGSGDLSLVASGSRTARQMLLLRNKQSRSPRYKSDQYHQSSSTTDAFCCHHITYSEACRCKR